VSVTVLRLAAEGQTCRQTAEALVLSDKTVKRHSSNISEKLGVNSRSAATVFGLRPGLA
jgi:DNA-binding NarL/FixJ family response regulator